MCLFGTSANPPTGDGGHRGIVSHLARANGVDEVRVLPVYRHMYASKRGNQASYDDRVAMCRLAFAGLPKVTVSESERTCFERAAVGLNGDDERAAVRVGTADLLDMLMADEPDADFALALGTDTFMDLTAWKWRRSRDVLSLTGGRVSVIYRLSEDAVPAADLAERIRSVNEECGGGVTAASAVEGRKESGTASAEGEHSSHGEEEEEEGPAKVIHIQSLSDVSSSYVRSCGNENALKNLLVPGVLKYIKENRMYGFADSVVNAG